MKIFTTSWYYLLRLLRLNLAYLLCSIKAGWPVLRCTQVFDSLFSGMFLRIEQSRISSSSFDHPSGGLGVAGAISRLTENYETRRLMARRLCGACYNQRLLCFMQTTPLAPMISQNLQFSSRRAFTHIIIHDKIYEYYSSSYVLRVIEKFNHIDQATKNSVHIAF